MISPDEIYSKALQSMTHADDMVYRASPTADLFHEDASLVRGLRGPVGCYSGDTEFLTPKGWVRFDKYTGYNDVAQWDEESKRISFVKPKNYIKLPCSEFIHFSDMHLSMMLSEEHRMALYNYRGAFEVKQVSEILRESDSGELSVRGEYTIPVPRVFAPSITLQNDTCSVERVSSQDGFKYCFNVPTGFLVVRHNDRVFISGNSGKTSTCCIEIYLRAIEQRPYNGVRYSRWALIRNTAPQLIDTTLASWKEWFEFYTKFKMSAPIRGTMKMSLPDGTKLNLELLFIALDRPDDLRKFKGMEVTGVFLNEAVELNKDVLDKAIERQNRYPSKRRGGASWSGVIMDTNSCGDRHWWYKYAEVVRPQNWKFYSQPPALLKFDKPYELDKFYDQNPNYPIEWRDMATVDMKDSIYIPNPAAENVENLNSGYQYWLDMIPGKAITYISVFVLNDYGTIVDGMPVYPEYQDAKHCAKENLKPYPNRGIVLGFDFGLMPSCSFSQQAPSGQKRVIDELCVEEHGAMGIRQFSRTVVVPYLIENYRDYLLKGLFQGWGGLEGGERVQTDERTAFIILNERLHPHATIEEAIELSLKGEQVSLGDLRITVKPTWTNKFKTRRDAVARLLMMNIDDEPGLIISPKCVTLRDGLRGHYCYKRMQIRGDAQYKLEPNKGATSHINDSLQADCLMSTPTVYDEVEVAEKREKAKKLEGLDNLALLAQESIERDLERWREEEDGYEEEIGVNWW